MHKLLERQLKKFGLSPAPAGLEGFLATVDAAYCQADRDRAMVERSLELASQELLQRNRQLRVDIERRKQLEVELAQAEKLRAVGQLASGIAHELNTPIQYVSDNVSFLERAFGTLAVRVTRTISASLPPRARKELDFIYANVPGAIEAAVEGCRRVAEIVGAMKVFAHPDSNDFVAADINRALTSTLAVAQNVVKNVADVTLDLADLPEVECRIGDVNQVFLNLIVNAAHAVTDRYRDSAQRGHIHLATRLRDGRVLIEVTDDGCGIPDAIRGRIFEPFFTTKGVGQGTGQGLAISRSIVVVKHGGLLGFVTTPGQGTTFTVELPVKRSPAAVDAARDAATSGTYPIPTAYDSAYDSPTAHGVARHPRPALRSISGSPPVEIREVESA
jgi:two-component system, NtrC family, sensor kinase